MANQIGVNTVSITGQITNPRYYEDSCKWTFILSANSGRYYVECNKPEMGPSIISGNQVMITGALFSRRTRDGCDSGSIRAREIVLLAQAA